MQKKETRFTAVGGKYLGKIPLTTEQKNAAEKVTEQLRSLSDEKKSCVIISR